MIETGGSERKEIEEALGQLRGKIDGGAEKLKSSLGTTVQQLSAFIESADRVIGQVMERVEETAKKTEQALNSAEKFAANFEHPVEYVKRNPVQAFTGALVAGMVIGLVYKRMGDSRRGERRLRIAPGPV